MKAVLRGRGKIFVLVAVAVIVAPIALLIGRARPIAAAYSWQKYPGNPIFTGTAPWNVQVAVTPIVLKVSGQYNMWFVGNNGQGWRIGYTTSPNGIDTWSTYPTDVIPVGTPDGWEKEVLDPSIIYDNGLYKMWYVSSNTDHWTVGSDRFRIRYATSLDGIHWNLTLGWVLYGTVGGWDEGGMNRGMSVLKVNGTYHMWYAATNTADLGVNPYWRIGYATSPDGINWTKQNNGNPVIEPTEPWEGDNVSGPNVIYENGTYKMWYEKRNGDSPSNELVYATSLDGINWTKPADENPALTSSAGFDSNLIFTPYVMRDGNVYKMWYAGFNGQYSSIGYATSEALDSSPVISPLSNATINEGDVYTTTSAFTDPDSNSWTATVDYGDGSGPQALPLNPDQTFTLSHQYRDEGSYTLTIAITDNQGATGTATATVTVNNAPFNIAAITGPTNPALVGNAIIASASFSDPGALDTHTAVWDWGDGTASQGTVTEVNGSGSVTDAHTYSAAGVYAITLTMTDDDGASTSSVFQYVVVYDPSAGFVTGGGWITSPAGAYAPNPSLTGKANFGFVAKYQNGATVPSGQTQFDFQVGNLTFQSTTYQWLVVSGAKAQYKGTGTINGGGNYTFLLTATDGQLPGGGGIDKFRIKIWDTASGTIVYDNQMGASDTADPTTALGGGSIIIHS